jgi:hypothetical protein
MDYLGLNIRMDYNGPDWYNPGEVVEVLEGKLAIGFGVGEIYQDEFSHVIDCDWEKGFLNGADCLSLHPLSSEVKQVQCAVKFCDDRRLGRSGPRVLIRGPESPSLLSLALVLTLFSYFTALCIPQSLKEVASVLGAEGEDWTRVLRVCERARGGHGGSPPPPIKLVDIV